MALPLFSTVLSPATFSAADNNTTITLALGTTTLVKAVTTGSFGWVGLVAASGNADGMVVAFQMVSSGFAISFRHESASATAGNRFRCIAFADTSGGNSVGTVWFRYNSASARWIHLAST